MTANNQMFEVLGRVMLLATVLVGVSLFVAPQPVEAQPYCFDCQSGIYQPGTEDHIDCAEALPQGSTSCRSGSQKYYDHWKGWERVYWCELDGSQCEALMLLDIAQDGMAELAMGGDEEGPGDGPEPAELRRTCDGVLLRGYGSVEDRSLASGVQSGGTLVIAL